MTKEKKKTKKGKVIETLPNLSYKVELNSGKEIIAHMSGKMRMNKIKVLRGDRVKVEMSKYDKDRGILTYRL